MSLFARISPGCCRNIQLLRGVDAIGHDLRTSLACLPALLRKPAAIGPDAAGRQSGDNRRNQLHQLCCETAVGSIEVTATLFLTRRGDSQYLGGRNGAGERQQIGAYRHRPFKPRDAGFGGRPSHHAERNTAFDFGLSAWAQHAAAMIRQRRHVCTLLGGVRIVNEPDDLHRMR